MTPSRQQSEREQFIVKTKNQCVREYHSEDTDVSAARVRASFCNCFTDFMTNSKEPKSAREALNYCERKLYGNSREHRYAQFSTRERKIESI